MMIFLNFLLCFLIAKDVMVGICVVWWYVVGGAKTPREWCEIRKMPCCGQWHQGWSALLPWPRSTYDWNLRLWEFACRTYHHPNSLPNQNCNDEKTTGVVVAPSLLSLISTDIHFSQKLDNYKSSFACWLVSLKYLWISFEFRKSANNKCQSRLSQRGE